MSGCKNGKILNSLKITASPYFLRFQDDYLNHIVGQVCPTYELAQQSMAVGQALPDKVKTILWCV